MHSSPGGRVCNGRVRASSLLFVGCFVLAAAPSQARADARTETAASQFIDDLHRRQLVSGDLFGLPDECFGVRERASSASVRRGGTGSVHRAQGTMSTVRVVGAAKTRPGEQASGAAVSRASKEQRNANETLQQRLRRKLIPLT